jgi:glycosyltransferase involved in cell wall biosynthesis
MEGATGTAPRICMHVIGVARTDARVMREASALVGAGYDVTIVDVESDPQAPSSEVFRGVDLRHIIMPSRYQPTRFKPFFLVKEERLTLAAARLMSHIPAEAYHAHDANALRACAIAARRRQKPLIFDAHELPYLNLDRRIARYRWFAKLAVRRLRQMTPQCAAVITVSDPIGEEFHRRFGGPLPTIVRNMPPYTPPQHSARLREQLGLPATARIALYQGGIQPNRGLDCTVLAARYLPPGYYVVLLGYGPSVEPLRALIEREGLGDRVRIVPRVPYEELLAWTASADLGLNLLPPDFSLNIKLCLPNKLFEYLMTGLPVLSSELPAVEDVLSTYHVGQVVSSLEPADIAQGIVAMLADADALARMRGHALEAARHLCWDVEQQRLLNLYRNLPGVMPPSGRLAAAASPGGGEKGDWDA